MIPHPGAIGPLVWAQLWQVTVVALVVGILVRLCCRNRPRWAYALWMLVVVKSLVPPVWSSPTGVFSWVLAGTAPAHDNASASSLWEVPGAPGLAAPGPVATRPTQGAIPNDDYDFRKCGFLFSSIWAAGLALCSAFVAGKWIACAALIRRSTIAADEERASLLADLSRRLGLRRKVRLLVTSQSVGPAAFGLFRPTVLLSELLLSGKTNDQLELILAHELIHIRRGDVLAGKLQLVAQLIWWFHPLVWRANRAASRERERCCDEEVVSGLGCTPALYARTLLDVLERKRRLRPLFALPGVRPVEITSRRLEHIMRHGNAYRQ